MNSTWVAWLTNKENCNYIDLNVNEVDGYMKFLG